MASYTITGTVTDALTRSAILTAETGAAAGFSIDSADGDRSTTEDTFFNVEQNYINNAGTSIYVQASSTNTGDVVINYPIQAAPTYDANGNFLTTGTIETSGTSDAGNTWTAASVTLAAGEAAILRHPDGDTTQGGEQFWYQVTNTVADADTMRDGRVDTTA